MIIFNIFFLLRFLWNLCSCGSSQCLKSIYRLGTVESGKNLLEALGKTFLKLFGINMRNLRLRSYRLCLHNGYRFRGSLCILHSCRCFFLRLFPYFFRFLKICHRCRRYPRQNRIFHFFRLLRFRTGLSSRFRLLIFLFLGR